jgi:hypothetical protein
MAILAKKILTNPIWVSKKKKNVEIYADFKSFENGLKNVFYKKNMGKKTWNKNAETLFCRSRGISTEEEDIRGFRQWNPSMQEDLLILRFVPVTSVLRYTERH